MNKNFIEGRPGQASGHITTKPYDSTRQVNEVVVWWRTAPLPGEIFGDMPEKSAEVIVIVETSRNQNSGGLTR
jgi:hypothetical protein